MNKECKKIHRRLETLNRRVNKIKAEISQLKRDCPHPDEEVSFKYGSDTGNYCRGDDCYWTTYHCMVCGDKWTVDGSHSEVIRI